VSSWILYDVRDAESNDEANEDLLADCNDEVNDDLLADCNDEVNEDLLADCNDEVNKDLLVLGEKFIFSYKIKSDKNIKQNNLNLKSIINNNLSRCVIIDFMQCLRYWI